VAAPYQTDIDCTDDETFEWSVPLVKADDGTTTIDFTLYDLEYGIELDGAKVFTSTTADDSIAVDGTRVTFSVPDGILTKGRRYTHGGRIHHIATGKRTQVFTGAITVRDGGFA
jgi:hypothetical protein